MDLFFKSDLSIYHAVGLFIPIPGAYICIFELLQDFPKTCTKCSQISTTSN